MKKLALSVILAFAVVVFAADRKDLEKVDTGAMTDELQGSAETSPGMSLAWWIPLEFWKISFAQDKSVGAADSAALVKALAPYTIVAVVRADIGPTGAFKFHDKARVQRALRVAFVSPGGRRTILKQAKTINKDADMLLKIMKPILSGAMGEMGKNFHFFVYANRDAKGKRIADPYKKGRMVVTLAKTRNETGGVIEIECPLDSLYIPRECVPCKKMAHVSWSFCPWCGKRLPTMSSARPSGPPATGPVPQAHGRRP